jgi:uncharacterized membrane protein YfcA
MNTGGRLGRTYCRPVSPWQLLAATVVIAIGAAIQGGVGFGMNVIGAPLLAFIDPELVPGPGLVAAMLLTVVLAVRERASIDRPKVATALVGRVPGTALGALLLASIPTRGVTFTVAGAVLLAAALNIGRPRLRPTPKTLLVAGVVSGFSSTVSSVGGPPMAVVWANEPGPVVRANLSMIFVVGAFISILGLIAIGEFDAHDAGMGLLLLIPGTFGFVVSRPLAGHLDAGRTRAAVLGVSVAGAVLVVLKELL